MLVLLSNRHHKSEVSLYQFLLGALTLTASLANLLGQLNLLVDRDHRFTTNLHQVLVECLTGTVGYTLANLKLSHKYPFTFLYVCVQFCKFRIHLLGYGLQSYKKNRNKFVISEDFFLSICLFYCTLGAVEHENCHFEQGFCCNMFEISNLLCTFAKSFAENYNEKINIRKIRDYV